jgi:hypothetical protein
MDDLSIPLIKTAYGAIVTDIAAFTPTPIATASAVVDTTPSVIAARTIRLVRVTGASTAASSAARVYASGIGRIVGAGTRAVGILRVVLAITATARATWIRRIGVAVRIGSRHRGAPVWLWVRRGANVGAGGGLACGRIVAVTTRRLATAVGCKNSNQYPRRLPGRCTVSVDLMSLNHTMQKARCLVSHRSVCIQGYLHHTRTACSQP